MISLFSNTYFSISHLSISIQARMTSASLRTHRYCTRLLHYRAFLLYFFLYHSLLVWVNRQWSGEWRRRVCPAEWDAAAAFSSSRLLSWSAAPRGRCGWWSMHAAAASHTHIHTPKRWCTLARLVISLSSGGTRRHGTLIVPPPRVQPSGFDPLSQQPAASLRCILRYAATATTISTGQCQMIERNSNEPISIFLLHWFEVKVHKKGRW